MQTLKFVSHMSGTSKKGKPYDMAEVSDGLASFTVSCAEGVGEQLDTLAEGEEFMAEVHVSVRFGALRATIVNVQV